MGRRAAAFLVGLLVVIVLGVGAVVIKLPYVLLTPGPTQNTLGSAGGQPFIQVKGHQTYAADGHLSLVTFYAFGNGTSDINVFAILQAWLSPGDGVISQGQADAEGLMTPPQDASSPAQLRQQMIAAALRELKIPFREAVVVASTEPGSPAAAVLRAGDVLTAVDGRPVTSIGGAGQQIDGRGPGQLVKITVDRGGMTRTFRLLTKPDPEGHAEIGVTLIGSFRFPLTVRVSNDACNGGCGLMFALALIDKLAPLNLTGGAFIAGTGTLDDAGNVGAVTNINVLMAGLRGRGATIFLTPAADCQQALQAAPTGMRLVKVSTLHGAVQALEALRAGRPVPGCTR